MGGLKDVLNHFVLKGAYVLAAYVVQRALALGLKQVRKGRPNTGDGDGSHASATQQQQQQRRRPPKSVPKYKLYHAPEREYTASNPRWLVEASAYDPAVLAADLSWQCPLLIEFQAKVAQQGGLPLELGKQARKQLFTLDPDFRYINHGSYGAAFRLSQEVAAWYQQQLELQPVRFMEAVALKALVAATADAASFLGCAAQDCVPVTNATGALNAVLRSVRLRRGDWALMLNTTYPAVKSTLVRVASAAGASVVEVQLGLEEMAQGAAGVLAALQSVLAVGGRRLKVAVLDHVVSFPPLVLPVAEMAAACKQVGAVVVVDGAHAAGLLPGLAVPSLGADFYATNLHKWCCTPKGAALLWAARPHQERLRPLVTSHGYGLGFRGEFLWQGTQDMSAWLAVPAALAVIRALGPQQLAERNARLATDAAAALVRAWSAPVGAPIAQQGALTTTPTPAAAAAGQPRVSQNDDSAAQQQQLMCLGGGCSMVAVQLPELDGYCPTPADAARLGALLRGTHRIEVPVVAALGRLWVRLSAHAYNVMEDYEVLGAAVAALRPGR